jgi:hypothetical protein
VDKFIVKWKLLCIKQQMDDHKYVIMSEFYGQDEKKIYVIPHSGKSTLHDYIPTSSEQDRLPKVD